MAIDGIFINHLITELNNTLKGARVERIRQKSNSSFIFSLYKEKTRYNLNLEISTNNQGLYITKKPIPESLHTQFNTFLRRHLESTTIKSFSQYESDRVIIITFNYFDYIYGEKEYKLVFEVMGRHANLILLDEENLIIDSFKKMVSSTGRNLMPKASFEYFPSDKKHINELDITNLSPKEIVDKYMGISPLLANYLVMNNTNYVSKLVLKPTFDQDSKRFYIFDIFESENKTYFNSISELLDSLVQFKKKKKERYIKFAEDRLKRLNKRKNNLKIDYENAQEALEFKNYADIIYSSGLNLRTQTTNISNLEIELNSSKNLNENAQNFYKKYHKAKRSLEQIEEQINITNEEILFFDSLLKISTFVEDKDISDIEIELEPYGYKLTKEQSSKNRKKTKKVNILKVDYDGAVIYAGKNNTQNAYLLENIANRTDYWFHIKDDVGGHIIVKTDKLTNKQIELASMLAAYFSNQKDSSSILVNYTQVKNLRRIPKKPIYTVQIKDYKTINIQIDKKVIESLIKQQSILK